MEKINVLTGNTIRLTCVFKDFDGVDTDPNTVKFIVYNSKQVMISETILGIGNKEAIGNYFYDFTASEEPGIYYFEWHGEISGKPAIQRGVIQATFISRG